MKQVEKYEIVNNNLKKLLNFSKDCFLYLIWSNLLRRGNIKVTIFVKTIYQKKQFQKCSIITAQKWICVWVKFFQFFFPFLIHFQNVLGQRKGLAGYPKSQSHQEEFCLTNHVTTWQIEAQRTRQGLHGGHRQVAFSRLDPKQPDSRPRVSREIRTVRCRQPVTEQGLTHVQRATHQQRQQ